MGSAYGVIRSASWNIFVDEGALVYDSVANHFTMDVVKMTTAIRKLLITIEGEGDSKSWTVGAIAAKAIALAGMEVVAYARALGGIEIKYSWEDLLGLNRSELAKSYLSCVPSAKRW
jgi:hypothetical protein